MHFAHQIGIAWLIELKFNKRARPLSRTVKRTPRKMIKAGRMTYNQIRGSYYLFPCDVIAAMLVDAKKNIFIFDINLILFCSIVFHENMN
jgi:hypothetical protein